MTTNNDLIVLHNRLRDLIAYGYEKYKFRMTDEERKLCEEYLYIQGEYEEALGNITAILERYKVKLDHESIHKNNEARKLMGLA
jgi:hypothetical protein